MKLKKSIDNVYLCNTAFFLFFLIFVIKIHQGWFKGFKNAKLNNIAKGMSEVHDQYCFFH